MRILLIGRWQPPHLGHLDLVKSAAEKGEVILAIGSAQKSHTPENPFTAGERIEMWVRVLKPLNINPIFVTLPDAPKHKIWVRWVEKMCPKFDIAITGDYISAKLLQSAGHKVESPNFYKRELFNGTKVRDKIVSGEEWKNLVPHEVSEYLEEIDGVARVKKSAAQRR